MIRIIFLDIKGKHYFFYNNDIYVESIILERMLLIHVHVYVHPLGTCELKSTEQFSLSILDNHKQCIDLPVRK